MTERLKRAMTAGYRAVFGQDYEYPVQNVSGSDKDFAQALIADLLLPDPPTPVDPGAQVITIGSGFDWGFNHCMHLIKVRAGLVEDSDA